VEFAALPDIDCTNGDNLYTLDWYTGERVWNWCEAQNEMFTRVRDPERLSLIFRSTDVSTGGSGFAAKYHPGKLSGLGAAIALAALG